MPAWTRKVLIAVAALGFAGAAVAQMDDPATAVAPRLNEIRKLNQNEIQVAQLAQKKAQNPQVKAFASKIVTDHQAVEKALETTASQRGIKLGNAPNQAQLDAGLKGAMSSLQNLSGGAFDQAYIDEEIGANQVVEDRLKALREATPGHDPTLKKWIDDTENLAEQHLSDARNLRSQLTSGSAGGQ